MTTTSSQKIRFAVVGAGNIAQVAVLPAFAHAENAELVALVSGDPVKRATLAERYQLEHVAPYERFEDVLREAQVDAVYLATPNSEHRSFTERAARLGVHVLCEKPMAPTVDDCIAMIAACAEANVHLMIAYRLHFDDATLAAIELVESGKIGEPRLFSAEFTQQSRPGDIRTRGSTAGGAIYDLGVYPINAARYLFRSEPTEVFAMSVEDHDPRFDGAHEAISALLRFPDDRLAQLSVSLAASAVSSYRIIGTHGDLRMEPGFGYTQGIKRFFTVNGETNEYQAPIRDQFAPEIVELARCITEGREPEPSGLEGLADIRIVEALLTSARTGRVVPLAPFEKTTRPTRAQAMKRAPVGEQRPIRAPSPTVSR